jgi:hypothetical protein
MRKIHRIVVWARGLIGLGHLSLRTRPKLACRSQRGRVNRALIVPGLLTVTGLLLLPVMAASSPPAWIGGIYDGGDGDDVVANVTDTTGATNGDLYKPLPLMMNLPHELALSAAKRTLD